MADEAIGLIIVPGLPKGKARARHVPGRKKPVSTVCPIEQAWRDRIRTAVREFMLRQDHQTQKTGYDGALKIDMDFFIPTKKTERFGTHHTMVPDKDNLEKIVLDAMKKAEFFTRDDSQSADGRIRKFWTPEGKGGVRIEISRPETPEVSPALVYDFDVENVGRPSYI